MVSEIIKHQNCYDMHTFPNMFPWAFIYIWSFSVHHFLLMCCSECWQCINHTFCDSAHSSIPPLQNKNSNFLASALTCSGEDGLVSSRPSEQLLVSSHCAAAVTSATVSSRKWALPLDTCQQNSQYQNSWYSSYNYEKLDMVYSTTQHKYFPMAFCVY
jgi:hypothetical protein